MDKRRQIGLLYTFDKGWLGGLYYAQNLLHALMYLDDDKRPIINVYCYNEDSFKNLVIATHYPYLKKNVLKESWFKRYLRFLLLPLSWRLAYNISLFKISSEDLFVFPYRWGRQTDKLLYWMPDFQDKYYPELFSWKERENRKLAIRSACKRGIPIVFSSYDSLSDFKHFYPDFASHKTYVMQFAVSHPDFSTCDLNSLKNKFNIQGQYLLCANQFWQHKNHLLLFEAFKQALGKGLEMKLVCTGNFCDKRNPQYIKKLSDYICNNGLERDIILLGIIDKKELLCLMKNSYAVIQPSLFEGWNTTVEDCKKLNKFIFLSDIKVHREQISDNVCFFDPRDSSDLASKLISITPEERIVDYSANLVNFANKFYSIIEDFASYECKKRKNSSC